MACIFENTKRIHTCCKLLKQSTNFKGKSHSSHLWLERHFKDPYVEKAKMENYRCRSAFKLLEIQESNKILSPGQTVIDCGASPGSWTQVAVKLCNSKGQIEDAPKGRVIFIDKLSMLPIDGAEMLSQLDFTLPEAQEKVRALLNGQKIDVLLSDMAPNACGIKHMDHERIVTLVYSAFKFSLGLMKTGGTFLAKIWDGGMTPQLCNDLSKFYKHVKRVRPAATHSDSTEMFLLARNFIGVKTK